MSNLLYFIVGRYFALLASIVLYRWKPRIIAVTGSAGKSTAVDLICSVLESKYTVRKSYKANSAIGVPLDILNIHPKRFNRKEWVSIAVKCIFSALRLLVAPYRAQIYVVELDSDRPGEMQFFSRLIKPEVIFLVSCYATHTANFEHLVSKGLHNNLKLAVSHEFFSFLSSSKSARLILVNGDIPEALLPPKGLQDNAILIRDSKGTSSFSSWELSKNKTLFDIKVLKDQFQFCIPYLTSRVIGYSLVASIHIAQYFDIDVKEVQKILTNTSLPPGRSTVFDGLNGTALIDSTYNSSYYATASMLEVLSTYPGRRKIAVLGDMRELGSLAKEEHENLAQDIIKYKVNNMVLVGPHMKEYVVPYLLNKGLNEDFVHHFPNTYQAGIYIKERLIKKADVLLFKASQNTLLFEIIVEMLLENKEDAQHLCRREEIWVKKRQQIIDEFYKTI